MNNSKEVCELLIIEDEGFVRTNVRKSLTKRARALVFLAVVGFAFAIYMSTFNPNSSLMNLSEELTTEQTSESNQIVSDPSVEPFIYNTLTPVEDLSTSQDQLSNEQSTNTSTQSTEQSTQQFEEPIFVDVLANMTQEEFEIKQLQKKRDKEVQKLAKKMDKFKRKLKKLDLETQDLFDELQKLDDKTQNVFDDLQNVEDKTQDLYESGYELMSDLKDFLKRNANQTSGLVLLQSQTEVTEVIEVTEVVEIEQELEEEEEILESDEEESKTKDGEKKEEAFDYSMYYNASASPFDYSKFYNASTFNYSKYAEKYAKSDEKSKKNDSEKQSQFIQSALSLQALTPKNTINDGFKKNFMNTFLGGNSTGMMGMDFMGGSFPGMGGDATGMGGMGFMGGNSTSSLPGMDFMGSTGMGGSFPGMGTDFPGSQFMKGLKESIGGNKVLAQIIIDELSETADLE